MNIHRNFSNFAFLAICMCLALPSFANLVDKKIYIVRRTKSPLEGPFLIGTGVAVNDEGEEISTGIFAILPTAWAPLLKKHIPSDATSVDVSLDKVPPAGLIEILNYRPKLYSETLPYLLAKLSPERVAQSLPADLLDTLTPDARKRIAREDLEELEKVYGSMKNSV